MTDSIFRGIATALITPFRNGEVDYDTFGRLIDWQIENGIDALVICGTTGEGFDPFRRRAQGVHSLCRGASCGPDGHHRRDRQQRYELRHQPDEVFLRRRRGRNARRHAVL